ncbi:MAG: hypothetical protein NUV47_02405 [Patescibacteria group bacterium]|nr:hypothetical protein [Patescibacteria group bacterium]
MAKVKLTQEQNIEKLVKLNQLDIFLKIGLLTVGSIGLYYGYIYGTEKMVEIQKQVEEYKKKLAKLPFVGSSFREG